MQYQANLIINFCKLAKRLGLSECEVYSCSCYLTVGNSQCNICLLLDSSLRVDDIKLYPLSFIAEHATAKLKDYPEGIIELTEYQLVSELPSYDILYDQDSLEDLIEGTNNKTLVEQLNLAAQLKSAKYGSYVFNKDCTLAVEWSNVTSDLYIDEETITTYLFLLRSGFHISLFQYSDYICLEAVKDSNHVFWNSKKTRDELKASIELNSLTQYLSNKYDSILPFGKVEFDPALLDNLQVNLSTLNVVNFKNHYRLECGSFNIIVMKKLKV